MKLVGFVMIHSLILNWECNIQKNVLHGSFNLPIFVYVDGVFFVREKLHV